MAVSPFIGEIQAFGFNFAPSGWAKCEGQLLPVASNTALFSLIGTTYGGNGRTTFALPDLRNTFPVHGVYPHNAAYTGIGERGGHQNLALSIKNLPTHSHNATLHVTTDNAALSTPKETSVIARPGKLDSREFTPSEGFKDTIPNITLSNSSVKVANTGDGEPFDNRPPYLGLNYCIALRGQYPTRN